MTTENKTTVTNSQTPVLPATEEKMFGNGRYSNEMERIYLSLQKLFGVEPAKAEKIAKQAGSDAGAVFRNTSATISVGKVNKDGKATIADASKLKGVTLTYPLSIVRAIQWVNEAGANYISYGHTKWQFEKVVADWIAELKVS